MTNENNGVPPGGRAGDATTTLPILTYTFGPFRIDVPSRLLLRDETVVPLTAKVFDTLLLLVKNHRVAVSKEDLIRAIWPNSFVSDDSLVQNISAIRRALGDDASHPQYIGTLSRRGYRFVGPVEEHTEQTPSPVAPVAPVANDKSGGHHVSPTPESVPTVSLPAWRRRPWIAAACMAGIAISAVVLLRLWAPTPSSRDAGAAVRFRETLPPGQELEGGARLSPDGLSIAFTARDNLGVVHLWVRALDASAARLVPGTEDARVPFWSPDSRFIGFFAKGQLKRVSPLSGPPRVITDTQGPPRGGAWMANDLILYGERGKIFSISSSGGTPTVVLEPDKLTTQGEPRWPHALPDGRHFLFFLNTETRDKAGTYIGTLGSHETRQLLGSNLSAMYVPPGYLLYVRDGTVMAQKFDVDRAQLQGDPMTVVSDVSANTTLSATAGGLLAMTEVTTRGRLLWLSRAGKEFKAVELPKPLGALTLSPNNKQLLGHSDEGGNFVVWLIDLDRNVSTQMATDSAFPVWAPDGDRFAYTSIRSGEGDLFVKSISGASEDVPWLKTNGVKVPTDWSADGRYIVFANLAQRNVWLLPTFGDRKPAPFLTSPNHTSNGRVSPDGRWLAYVSDETGKKEICIQSFPTPGAKRQVSTNGGGQPVWRQDGRELFYLSDDHQVMAVTIRPADGEPGPAQALFMAPEPTSQFAVTKDGQSFLVVARDPHGDRRSITLLTNWEAAQTPN